MAGIGSVIAHIGADISGYQSAMSKLPGITRSAMSSSAGTTATLTGATSKLGSFIASHLPRSYSFVQKASSGFGKSVMNDYKQIQNGGKATGSSVTGMAAKFGALVASGAIIKSAVSRVDTLNNSTRTFNNMGFKTADVDSAMNGLQKSIKGLPTSLDDAVSGVQLFAASTGDVKLAQKVWSGVNDAVLGFGGTAGQAQEATVQLSQAFANGKVDAATWNSMINDGMGPALKALSKQMGISMGDLKSGLSDGSISVADFQQGLINLDTKGGGGMKSLSKIAKDSASGIGTGFQNMETAVVRGVGNIINAFGSANISNFISGIGSALEGAANAMVPFATALGNTVTWLAQLNSKTGVITALAVAFGVFVGVIGTYNAVLRIAAAVQAAFNAVMEINPFVLVIAAIAAVVAALVYFFTQTKLGQSIWQSFTTWLGTAWQWLATTAVSVWTSIATFFTTIWTGIVTGATTAWTGITTFLTSIWTFISTTAMSVWTGITTFFTTIWDGIVSVVTSVWTGISTFLTTIWNGIKTVASIVWTGLKVLIAGIAVAILVAVTGPFGALAIFVAANFNTIKSIASSVWNSIKSVISSVVNTIKSVVTSVWNAIKSVTSSVWNSIKSLTSSTWNGIKSVISSVVNSIRSVVTSVWNGIKSVTSSAWNGIKSVISSGINAARSIVSSAVNAMRSAATSAWNAMKSAASSVVSGIKSAFHSLTSINLGAAGRAIMNSFMGGLQAAWGKVKSFVSGIGSWIKAHKGPISYDRRLLIPAGQAIMGGFGKSLNTNFASVQRDVLGYAGAIADQFNNQKYEASARLTASSSAVAGKINGGLEALDSDVREQAAQSPIFEVYNELVGDKITTTVNSKNARRQSMTQFMNGGI